MQLIYPRIKWKLKETLPGLFAFYYRVLGRSHNSSPKWAQHGMKIDLNFELMSCWFITCLVHLIPTTLGMSATRQPASVWTWLPQLGLQRPETKVSAEEVEVYERQKCNCCLINLPHSSHENEEESGIKKKKTATQQQQDFNGHLLVLGSLHHA